MQRDKRHQLIIEIIAAREIDTQEELCEELRKRNINVTQATVSRDIKDLKICKVSGTQKKYRYASIDTYVNSVSDRMTNLFSECVLSINLANNLIIIKTLRGNGSTVGVFVDSLQINEILGCVAGDDTLLVIIDTNEHAVGVVEQLKAYIK